MSRIQALHHLILPMLPHPLSSARGSSVAQELRQVAKGMSWDVITAEWRGTVSKEAIAEAVELAQQAFEDHPAELFVQ